MKTSLAQAGAWVVMAIGIAMSVSSWSQAYPVKPIRLVASGPTAGGVDVIARPLARKLSESLGQPVLVDNRPGANGTLAAHLVATSPPDGYNVLITTANGSSIWPLLAKNLPYDPERDFAPVTLVATASLLAAVHPSLPVKSIRELIGLAKARPDQLLYASNGTGSIQHLTAEMFSQAAGIRMVHVPYNGGPPAVANTMSGYVQLVITAVPTVLSQVRASRLRALAVTGATRSSAAPEIPTIAESGVPGFESVQYYAIFAPKKTPTAVIEKLYNEIRAACESPTVKMLLAREGADLAVNGPQALAEFRRTESARWRKVIRQANLALE